MEHTPLTTYLDDFLATNIKRMEQEIAKARERFSIETESMDMPPILRGLSPEEWGMVRSIIEETLQAHDRLTDNLKLSLLYLSAESWDTVFWTMEHAWREESELEEPLVQSYRKEIEAIVLQTLPCMLPPHRLQELTLQHEREIGKIHDADGLFREIQRIREEADRRATAIRQWCAQIKST